MAPAFLPLTSPDTRVERTPKSQRWLAAIETIALQSLYQELACYPKPGLVSFADAGSHHDMNADTFMRSIASLRGYFLDMAVAGADGDDFRALNVIGRRAEQCMFRVTGGRNTHRGAIFSLGLLSAAAGWCLVHGRSSAEEICATVATRWGRDILDRKCALDLVSLGDIVPSRHGAVGAREEAAAGFPTLVDHALQALRAAERGGAGRKLAALQALFAVMAVLEDSNLLYRGGASGLLFAQTSAMGLLAEGGVLMPGGYERALALHQAFVMARLSPGGAADLLAATLFLAACEKRGGGRWA